MGKKLKGSKNRVILPKPRDLLGGTVKNTARLQDAPLSFPSAFLNNSFPFLQSLSLNFGAANQFSPEGRKCDYQNWGQTYQVMHL